MNPLQKFFEKSKVKAPQFHVVLGSGFKDAVQIGLPNFYQIKSEILFSELGNLPESTVQGHTGKIVLIENQSNGEVGILQIGRLHGYEGLSPKEVIKPLMMSRELGTQMFYLTNAAGGIDQHHEPGHAMLISDHINLTGTSPLIGENPKKINGEYWGPRFPDMTRVYDFEIRSKLKIALEAEKCKTHEGVYAGVMGPAYETPAEIRYYRSVGAHAVGMSTVWEAIALKHTGAKVAGISLISNVAAGLSSNPDEVLSHEDVLNVCKDSSVKILKAILLSRTN